MFFAGTPAQVVFSGTSLITMLPAPIIALFPIFTPPRIQAWHPIKTLSPITGWLLSCEPPCPPIVTP